MSTHEEALLPPEQQPGAPTFAEPWHAEVLGVANVLLASGMFSASEWAAALGAGIRQGADADEPDPTGGYYHAVLAALERLVAEKSPETGGLLPGRIEAWRRAYMNTPHGMPVTLEAAGEGGEDHRHHVDHHHHGD